jgi:hypothetical protein
MADVVPIVSTVEQHVVPPLLHRVLTFVAQHEEILLGYCEFAVEPITPYWSRDNADRLAAAGFSFLKSPNDSYLSVLMLGDNTVVVELESEGSAITAGDSIEDFLWRWANGDGIMGDLPSEPDAVGLLAQWLRDNNIADPPKVAVPFDFQVWLDGGTGYEQAPPTDIERTPTDVVATLDPRLRDIATMVGRRADDPVLLDWLTAQLGKIPRLGWQVNVEPQHVTITMLGMILNHRYPVLRKSANAYVDYVAQAVLAPDCGYDVLSVPWSSTAAEIENILGAPTTRKASGWIDPPTIPVWIRTLDCGAGVELVIEHDSAMTICLRVASAESLNSVHPATLALFVGWACENNLLDPAAFADHSELFDAVRARRATGGELVDACMPRGFWMTNMVDRPGLRQLTIAWFSAYWDFYIVKELLAVFGAATDGHEHADIGEFWPAVDRAAPVFQARYAAWL